MENLPAAPKKFSVAAVPHTIKAGTKLWRIYFRSGPYPTAWNAVRYFGPTGSRFDHHTYPKRVQERGILYATAGPNSILTALAEVFQDTRLIDRLRQDPWIVGFHLAKDVTLLNTGSTWPVRAGGNMAINSGSRNRAREWSRAIYRNYPLIGGVWYPSSLTNDSCAALYERSVACLPIAPTFNEALSSPKLFAGLTMLASRLNFALK